MFATLLFLLAFGIAHEAVSGPIYGPFDAVQTSTIRHLIHAGLDAVGNFSDSVLGQDSANGSIPLEPLSLPDVSNGSIPQLPQSLSQLYHLPQLPQFPQFPQLPQLPQLSQLPLMAQLNPFQAQH